MLIMIFIALVLIVNVALATDASLRIYVNTSTTLFQDAAGRVRLFRGVNAVYKVPPWLPKSEGFDSDFSLSALDAKNLSDWGFNFVRLGVMWPGLMPKKGYIDPTYMPAVLKIVKLLAAEGIYTLADFHQDDINRMFCGEGAPDWAVDYPRPGISLFPLPIHSHYTDVDPITHYPALNVCLSHGFGGYQFSEAVAIIFEDLYLNRKGMQDHFIDYWGNVSQVLAKVGPEVIGYELINEPFPGNIYNHPWFLIPGVADRASLAPMYEKLSTRIRRYDDESLIFFEKAVFPGQFTPGGFTHVPGGNQYRNRSVFSYHIYCGNPQSTGVCNAEDLEEFDVDLHNAQGLQTGAMMTEFGALNGSAIPLKSLDVLLTRADKFFQSWAYWQFKYYHDLSTVDAATESLYNKDGSLQLDKLRMLSRTYPQAVMGMPRQLVFDPVTALFNFTYTLPDNPSPSQLPTDIYLNEALHYPNGYGLLVNSTAWVSYTQTRNHILITSKPGAPPFAEISIFIYPK